MKLIEALGFDKSILNSIKNKILELCPIALEIYLFGSRATKSAKKDSDYDIMVVIPANENFIEYQLLLQKYNNEQGHNVQIIVKTIDQFDNASYVDPAYWIRRGEGFKIY